MEMMKMKRAVCLIIALLVCISMAGSVFAEEFVPSISYKGAPEIVTVKDAEGKDAIGIVRDAAGKVLSYVYSDCLLLTPVSSAANSTTIPEASKTELLSVYAALTDGSMTLPYGSDVDADSMVIKDLFDLSWICTEHGHPEQIEPEGVTLELTFDMGVDKNANVVVMTYKNSAWGEIVKAENNGDGTVTCTFEHLCPVSVSVGNSADITPPAETSDTLGQELVMWTALMAVSAAAVVVLLVVRRKAQQ